MKPYLLSRIFILLAFFTACSESQPTVVYLVRHAEKDLNDTTENPPLTTAGLERAERLKEAINVEQIDGIYSTHFERNIATVNPLAQKHGLEINTYDWYNWHSMVDGIKNAEGKTYVICGHGDNLLPMIEYMAGRSPIDSLGKYEYDKIFRVEISSDTTIVEMISY